MPRLTKALLWLTGLGLWSFAAALPASAQVEIPVPIPVEVPAAPAVVPAAPSLGPVGPEQSGGQPSEPSKQPEKKGFCSHLGIFAGGCEALNSISGAVQDPTALPGNAVDAVVDRAAGLSVGAITDWAANGAAWLMGQLGGLIDRTTTPQLEAGWFTEHYRAMVGLAAIIVLPLLLLSIIGALVEQDLTRLLRTTFGYLPLAGIYAGTAVAFVALGLTITDQMTAWVTQGTSADATTFLTRSADALHGLQGGNDGAMFAVFLGALVMAVGAVVVWIELLVRQAAIYVAVLFLPLAIAGLVWPATAHWCKRLAHILTAVILSKFVIAAILSLAASGLAATTPEGGGFSAVLGGGALLTLAAVSPLALLRLAPMLEAGFVTSTSNARSGKTAATGAAVGGPSWLYGQARNWANRDATTPPLRSWTRPTPSAAGANGGGIGGPKPWTPRNTNGRNPISERQTATQQLIAQPAEPPLATPVGVGAGGNGRRRIGDPPGTSRSKTDGR